MAIFDLPVLTPEQRRAATKFRNFLLDDGYLMIQYSVYARPCVSYEHMEKHTARIKGEAPRTGFIRIMFFTDKQWTMGINVLGKEMDIGNRVPAPDIPEQILFW